MRTKHMKCLAGVTAATATVLGLSAGPTAASGHHEHVVRPGESIQEAVDAAHPGDTVVVLPGTYRESVLITTSGLTLRGTGERTVVAPQAAGTAPADPAAAPPKTTAGAPAPAKGPRALNACAAGGNGICVVGTEKNPVDGVRIRALTVSGFTKSGVWSSRTDGLSVRRVTARDNGTWGIAQEHSTRADIRRNTTTGNGDAGIFVANAVNEEGGATDTGGTTIADNEVSGNRIGVTARRVRNLLIDDNTITGNCSGIFVVGDESKPAAGAMTISGNRIVKNNKLCAATPRLSAIQGSGIVLTGSENTVVRSNVIQDNVGTTDFSGGVLLFKSFVGALNTGNTVSENLVSGNSPADLANRDTAGTGNTFTGNTCATSVPAGMCAE
ncbi:nitrous oxide reductase family maturation protein NosD [Streptomyces sp. NBC_00102]|uniref:right-handed parallel beta-helix repeat-containing protein n=1 Tax=Streptomyces sp. NBC_00102 TaxID=2975652 RepID=UPI002258A002|nr:right-handed parallel beta-helix repeat-containing protein [Streptomyces sp. NBC_00102]MCX5401702.1 right-handed parallel beta-helix repeat-containing protein [Streptomyces sp. NBC_00102]